MSREVINRLKTGELPMDFDWNTQPHPLSRVPKLLPADPKPQQILHTKLVAEDLRDGLHGVPNYPEVPKMLEYVGVLSQLGIDTMTVGIYTGDGKINNSIKKLLGSMRDQYPQVSPIVLSLAREDSINWAADCKQINQNLQAIVFMGSAPSRMIAQEWTQDYVLRQLALSTKQAVKHDIDVIGATEHTTQTPPDFLKKIIKTQVDNGAKSFCAADTIGIARPIGAYRQVRFIKKTLKEMGREDVLVEWHGHRDTGNETANAMWAISAGADRIHIVSWGYGERAGNTKLETVMINMTNILEENGIKSPWERKMLSKVLNLYSDLVNIPSPTHGTMGANSQETSLGIHTDAKLKAERLADEAREDGETELAAKLEQMGRRIYTAVDPESVGKEETISVGPWSGKSTVILAARHLGIKNIPSEKTIANILKTTRSFGRVLTPQELRNLLANNH